MSRLTEPSTWRGLVAVVAAVGIILDPANAAGLTAAALALIGAINIATPERKP